MVEINFIVNGKATITLTRKSCIDSNIFFETLTGNIEKITNKHKIKTFILTINGYEINGTLDLRHKLIKTFRKCKTLFVNINSIAGENNAKL